MPHLDLGTALLIWVLVGTLAHEYGHSSATKMCGSKTIGFFASPIPGVLPSPPSRKSQAILILVGGWVFGVISIIPFLPFVSPEYLVPFLVTALLIQTVLSGMGDFVGIFFFAIRYDPKDWVKWIEGVAETPNKMARFGLSKIVVVDNDEYDQILRPLIRHEHSIAFVNDSRGRRWMVLLSLLAIAAALMVAIVNWPVFAILSWVGFAIEADFSILFVVLVGTALVLSLPDRLMSQHSRK